jgi:hypothetical protein
MRRTVFAVCCLLLLSVSLPAGVNVVATDPHHAAAAEKDETVSFNTKSYKYHCVTCSAAQRCTRNCVDIPKSEAKARGGMACKICGGTCL